MSEKKTHASLFSGIGGFDLAAEWMGWENVFHCEIEAFAQQILKYYWPKAISYADIKKTDFTIHRGQIDILTGGFPCQPFSTAGKRLGTEDDRNLWPQMCRAVREIQPPWVIAENVLGIVNWSGGLVFDQVQADLENEGYQVTPFILPACSKNAPHRRERVWFVAYSESNSRNNAVRNERQKSQEVPQKRFNESFSTSNAKCQRKPPQKHFGCSHVSRPYPYAGLFRSEKRQKPPMGINKLCEERPITNPTRDGQQLRRFGENRQKEIEGQSKKNKRQRIWPNNRRTGQQRFPAHACSKRLQRAEWPKAHGEQREKPHGSTSKFNRIPTWDNWPTQSPVCGRDDGLSSRLVGITVPKHRRESLKAYGNAIVPQVALSIFKTINRYENRRI